MGAGKTTVGRKLAQRLGYVFIDTDQKIEKHQSCSIRDIFKYAGEECFRDLESDLLKKLQTSENTVFATGGGMVLRKQNRKLMKSLGKRVHLKVSFAELFRRLKKDKKRPLLQHENPELHIKEMLEERNKVYDEAEFIIDASQMNSQQLIAEIIKKYEKNW